MLDNLEIHVSISVGILVSTHLYLYDLYNAFELFMFQSTNSNFYKTRSGRRESLVGSGGGALSGGCWEMGPLKVVALVVCPLKTNAGVYRNALYSGFYQRLKPAFDKYLY